MAYRQQTSWTERTAAEASPANDVDRLVKRHGFYEPHTVLGVLAHWVGLAGTMAPIVIGELVADPAKSRKWVRLSAVGSTVAFQALHTVRELLHRKEQEKKLAECQSRGG